MPIISINCLTNELSYQPLCIGAAILDDDYNLKETMCLRLKNSEIVVGVIDNVNIKNILSSMKNIKITGNLSAKLSLFLTDGIEKYFKNNYVIKILITSIKQGSCMGEMNLLDSYEIQSILINKQLEIIDVSNMILAKEKKNLSISEYIKCKGYFPNEQINYPLGDAINTAIAYSILMK